MFLRPHCRIVLVVVAGSALAAACLEAREGQSGERDDLAASDSADSGNVRDTAPPETAAPADSEDPKPDACRTSLVVERQGVLDLVDQYLEASRPVVMEGTTVFGVRSTRNGTDQGDQIVAIDVALGEERVLVREGHNRLVDARDGALLYARHNLADGSSQLRYRDLESGSEVPLATAEVRADGQVVVLPGDYAFEQPKRLVERGAAAWGEIAYSVPPIGRVRMLLRDEITTVFEGETQITTPYLLGENVLFTSFGRLNTLWLARGGGRAVAIREGMFNGYALSRDAAWWLQDGAVMRQGLDEREAHRLHEGPCSMLVTDGERAAALCGGNGSGGWSAAFAGKPVVFGPGDKRVELATPDYAQLAGLTLAGRLLAWVDYPAGAGCHESVEGVTGELRITDLERPEEPQLVATVGVGCWCCDAYWPPMQVALSSSGLAWNYALADAPRWERPAAVGWGLFSEVCR